MNMIKKRKCPNISVLLGSAYVVFLLLVGTEVGAAEKKLIFDQEKDRYSFAQMHLGYEYGQFDLKIPSVANQPFSDKAEIHNILLGGWHFWGMADFFVSFPFKSYDSNGRKFTPGVETSFRWYPSRIAHNKVRPFLGVGFSFLSYQQADNAPRIRETVYPLQAGLSVANQSFQVEFGVRYFNQNQFDYSVSTSQKKIFEIDNYALFIAIKRVVDTTILTKRLGLHNQKVGFYPFIGLGPSAAWVLDGNNTYFEQNAPWIDNDLSINILPEVTLGVHWKNSDSLSQRTFFQLAWRQMNYKLSGFGADYEIDYSSYAFEVAQSLFDYNGFVPFIGLSYNNATIKVSKDVSAQEQKNVVGAFFGWDILPAGTNMSWALRTNLRWYPDLSVEVNPSQKIAVPNFEFNFIQWVYQF